jgi:GxxExxY protein
MANLIYKDESYKIMGACFEVYQTLGRGFLEPVYQECLEIEFADRGIPFVPQREPHIVYKERTLKQFYKADFVCYDQIIVEVKAIGQLVAEHRAQTFNYLKATGKRLGILVNFGAHPKLEHHRIVL